MAGCSTGRRSRRIGDGTGDLCGPAHAKPDDETSNQPERLGAVNSRHPDRIGRNSRSAKAQTTLTCRASAAIGSQVASATARHVRSTVDERILCWALIDLPYLSVVTRTRQVSCVT